MRKKLIATLFAAGALLGAPVLLNSAPAADASTCASRVPVVCDVYTGAVRVVCNAAAKYADCIQ